MSRPCGIISSRYSNGGRRDKNHLASLKVMTAADPADKRVRLWEVRLTKIPVALLAAMLVAHTPVLHATPAGDLSDRPRVGSLREAARREGARLATISDSRSAVQTPAPQRNWAARHPVIVGTLAGAGVGLGFAAANGCESSDYTCGGLALFFGG